jgi:deoxyadenosine/deoxycytidine kinase
MAKPGTMRETALERYGKPLDEIIPELIQELGTVHKVAVQLDVYPQAVRRWLKLRGWNYENGHWVMEPEHVN